MNHDFSLIFVGDIMLDRKVKKIIESKNDINWPFRKISKFLKSGDIVIGNMESPILKKGEIDKKFVKCNKHSSGCCEGKCVFKTDPIMIQSLKKANISMVSVANNHIFDYGVDGYQKTIRYLLTNEVEPIGFDHVAIIDVTVNIKIGVVAYCFAFIQQTDIAILLNQIKDDLNHLSICQTKIVILHGGKEYQKTPTRLQKTIAKFAIDNGADLLIGHHSHVKQLIDIYKGKYIFYGLGNFIFDQDWDRTKNTRNGYGLKIIFDTKKGIINQYELSDIFINDDYQPLIKKTTILKNLLSVKI